MAFTGHKNVSTPDGNNSEAWYQYTCNHCHSKVSGAVVASYSSKDSGGYTLNKWLLCPNCVKASIAINNKVIPGSKFGPNIQGLPDDIDKTYGEVRECMMVNAFTASELLCRKILMHVAVEKGAKEGENFASYITFLSNEGYVTPPMKTWVDLIRQHGNKSTHKLDSPDKKRAESTVMFTAELLRLVYEMDFIAQQYTT